MINIDMFIYLLKLIFSDDVECLLSISPYCNETCLVCTCVTIGFWPIGSVFTSVEDAANIYNKSFSALKLRRGATLK